LFKGISTKKRKREENLKIAKKRMKCGAAGTRSKPTAQNQRRSAKGKHSHSKRYGSYNGNRHAHVHTFFHLHGRFFFCVKFIVNLSSLSFLH